MARKGLLVNTLDAYEEYYRQRAQLWEIQALTRTRPGGGRFETGRAISKTGGGVDGFLRSRPGVAPVSISMKSKRDRLEACPTLPACYTPDWKKQIHQMRMRIEKERTPRGQDDLAIKTGRGGLMDAEFIAQVLCLENGWHEPNTLRALERGREAGILPDAGQTARSLSPPAPG